MFGQNFLIKRAGSDFLGPDFFGPDIFRAAVNPAILILVLLWVLIYPKPGLAIDDAVPALRVTGDVKIRAEFVGTQFRAGDPDPVDQALLFKSHLGIEGDIGKLTLGAELEDARVYFDDARTPLSTGFVNAMDFLQVYAKATSRDFLAPGSKQTLTLGRQTMDIGSRRVIGRNAFRNTTNSFTGLRSVTEFRSGNRLEMIAVTPVSRFPSDRQAVGRNAIRLDRERFNRFMGVAFYHVAALPFDIKADLYLIGYYEKDGQNEPTANRRFLSPGVRVFRRQKDHGIGFDLEYLRRFGSQRASSAATDTQDLTLAGVSLFHLDIGYRFTGPFFPRLALEYDLASGDKDPNDGKFNRHDRLFNLRRGDLGNSSLFGPLAQENVEAFGAVLEFDNRDRLSGRVFLKGTWLAAARDRFPIARLQDETGGAGRYTGMLVDTRLRYWVWRDHLRAEIGGGLLTGSRYRRVVDGSPTGDASVFGYAQVHFFF